MATATLLCSPRLFSLSPSVVRTSPALRTQSMKPPIFPILLNQKAMASLFGAGLALALVESASAAQLPLLTTSLQFSEPANALSLPTWAIHVSSVVEWITAMILVWKYGEQPGFESWKGLSWGMVPLLGGAFCACTWHFFYNSESLEVLVALQAALTVLGNATMCIAAFRIYQSSQERSKNLVVIGWFNGDRQKSGSLGYIYKQGILLPPVSTLSIKWIDLKPLWLHRYAIFLFQSFGFIIISCRICRLSDSCYFLFSRN